ncbi:MAG TPA: CpaD family pilus assembly lipoprotein [Candidatus Cybelea sp.]|nr:CpaD family pilus assembly lipoprotein [Candidatus Cybelea sp.]
MASRQLIPAALLGAVALTLVGCNAPDLASYDPHAKFAAQVSQKTAVLFLEPAGNGAVQGADRQRIDEFAKDFRDRNAGPIGIAVGATSKTDPAAVAFANNIRASLAAQGIPAAAVDVTLHPEWSAGAAHRATVMFPIWVAEVPDCGMTNEYLEVNFYNQDWGNLGCATERNTALMAVNPLDLQQMQPPSGRYGERSFDVVTKYDTATIISSPQEAEPTKTSNVSQ